MLTTAGITATYNNPAVDFLAKDDWRLDDWRDKQEKPEAT